MQLPLFNLDRDIVKQFTPTDLNTSSLNYKNHVRLLNEFKRAGGKYSSEFNIFDNPGRLYFKILFHFDTPSGLLHPTWNYASGQYIQPKFNKNGADELDWYTYSTAFSYLMQNDEEERAEYLKQFILLLSNINTESPWYFTSLAGLDSVIQRHEFFKDPKIETSERRKITINCLEDAIDNRLMTLMDLYRHTCYSWMHKRIMLPSNVRRFDMTIILYSLPIKRYHVPVKTPKIADLLGTAGKYFDNPTNSSNEYASFGNINNPNNQTYIASYKTFTFTGCEFYFPAETYGELFNGGDENGWSPKPSIEISYDDCFESRYNEFLPEMVITDLLKLDSTYFSLYDAKTRTGEAITEIPVGTIEPDTIENNAKNRPTYITKANKNLDTLTDQALGYLAGKTAPTINSKVVLGNMHGFSLSDVTRTINQAGDLQVAQTIQALKKDHLNNYFSDGLKRGDGNNRGFIRSKLN